MAMSAESNNAIGQFMIDQLRMSNDAHVYRWVVHHNGSHMNEIEIAATVRFSNGGSARVVMNMSYTDYQNIITKEK